MYRLKKVGRHFKWGIRSFLLMRDYVGLPFFSPVGHPDQPRWRGIVKYLRKANCMGCMGPAYGK